ncbi:hypothetical protein BH11BAC1_BH11BAC1_15040 [soil metagenome]
MKKNNLSQNISNEFISIDGEMAQLTREKDWCNTPVGCIDEWQQSLRSLVGIVLNSNFPMFLFWGPELICFYNDAYRPSLGENGKHPSLLGMRAEEGWVEIWNIIKPLIDQVLSGAGATWSEDQLIPIFRNGKIEDVYWTFSYSPVNDDTGKIGGVMVTCIETTDKVITKLKLEESERRNRSMILQAPVSIGIFRGKDYITEMANARSLELWGRTEEEVLNKPILEAMPELKSQGIKELMDGVFTTGVVYSVSELEVNILRNGKEVTIYVNASWEPIYNSAGEIDGIMASGIEVTEQVSARKKIKESEERFRAMADNIPNLAWMAQPDGWIYWYNKKWYEYTGTTQEQMEGWGWQSVHDSKTLPEVLAKWKNSIDEGKKFEMIFPLLGADGQFRHFLTRVLPVYNEHKEIVQWFGSNTDISEQLESSRRIEENEKKLNIVLKASELGTFKLDLQSDDVDCSDRFHEIFGYVNGEKLDHKSFLNHLYPDDVAIRNAAFDYAIKSGNLEYQSRISLSDHSIKWIEVKGKIFYDDHNKPLSAVGTCRDITKEKTDSRELADREQKFRLLADFMPQHIWTADPKGNLNYYNQSVFDYSGLTNEQINKVGWLQIVHPDDRERNVKEWVEAVKTGKDFLFEHRFRRHDGAYRWQLSRAKAQRDENENILMWVGTSTDIQEQKTFRDELEKQVKERTAELVELNETLKTSEERYHFMVGAVQDYAILYLNREGIVENWNAGAEKIKGYKASEIIGKSFVNFYTEEDRKNQLPQRLLKVATKRGRARHEGWRVRKDGTLFWASVVITAVHNEQKKLIGFSKVTHDLTAKRQADIALKEKKLELEQKNRDLEKMNKELQSFAYISSHDLQEPLRKIQTFASRITDTEKDSLSENGKDLFNRMQACAERMQALIDDLLAYSRTHTLERDFQKVNLGIVLEKVIQDLNEEIQQRNATIDILELCEVNIIPFQFRQLFYNLISNSLKFSSPERSLHILIKSEIGKGSKFDNKNLQGDLNYCHISVADNGIGYESQYNEKIFELFQRLHGRNEYRGTGIGLAIVKRIVENHNGIITANGENGKGATFHIYLPIPGN